MLKRIFNFSVFFVIIYFPIIGYAEETAKENSIPLFITEISINGSASQYTNSTHVNTFVTSWGGGLSFTFAGTETIELEYKNAYQKSKTDEVLVRSFYDSYGVNYLHAMNYSRIQPFLKIGIGYVKAKYKISSDVHPEINKEIKQDPTLSYLGGIGIKIHITRSISFYASYTGQYIDGEEFANGDSNTQLNYFVNGGLSFVL